MKLDNSNKAHKLIDTDCYYVGFKSIEDLDIDVYLTNHTKGLLIEIDANTFIYDEVQGTIEPI